MKLASRDPSNTKSQLALVVSHWKLGSLAGPALSDKDRRAFLTKGLGLLETLEDKGRLPEAKRYELDLFRKALREAGDVQPGAHIP